MFTQCPECEIAFRVTASVLQQAGGNVRCGSCSHAFNALEYLSEDMPDHEVTDGDDPAAEPVDDLAETSRRLLQTLDELAGPEEVRIEDTGVEWRVLDEASAENVKLSPGESADQGERRYDDNTPLPDDFDDERDYARPPQRRDEDQQNKSGEFEDRQGDLALSEPEDWTDILQEVRDPNAESLEVEEELAAIHNELSAIDEALTDEVPQIDESELDALANAEPDEEEADLIDQIEAGAVAELAADDEEEFVKEEDDEEEVDTGVFELVDAEEDSDDEVAEGDDLENDGVEDEDADAEDNDTGHNILSFDRESTGEFDQHIDVAADAFLDDAEEDEAGSNEGIHEGIDEKTDDDFVDDEDGAAEEQEDSGEAEVDEAWPDEPLPDNEPDIDAESDENSIAADSEDDRFAATLHGMENPEDLFDENSNEVETIIMEGDFIRNEIEKERDAAENAARSQLDDPAKLLDTYALNRGKVRGGRRRYDPPSSAILGAIVVLGIVLAAQFVHNSRQSLATFGFFNSTIAPVYRMLGSPITPDWDIKGWQFEATNGSVDEEETTLTVVSRIVNRSAQSLPYPLVHISLTDRFEDIMGSRILEPGEYLAGDGDPSRPIAPGENFTALITVNDPSVEATGFKLNVCYRVEPGTVRCAIEDFKN